MISINAVAFRQHYAWILHSIMRQYFSTTNYENGYFLALFGVLDVYTSIDVKSGIKFQRLLLLLGNTRIQHDKFCSKIHFYKTACWNFMHWQDLLCTDPWL